MRGRPRQRRQDETEEKKKTKRRRVENGQIQFHGLLEWMALHIKDISLSPVVHSFRPLFSREREGERPTVRATSSPLLDIGSLLFSLILPAAHCEEVKKLQRERERERVRE